MRHKMFGVNRKQEGGGAIIVAPEFNVPSSDVRVSPDLGVTWDVNTTAQAIVAPNVLRYAMARNGIIAIQPFGTNVRPVGIYSNDGGVSFTGASISSGSTQARGMSFNGQHILFGRYSSPGRIIWYSPDSGSTWSSYTFQVGDVLGLAVSDDADYFYQANFTTNVLKRSINTMASWVNISTPYASYFLNYVVCGRDGSFVIASPRNIAGRIWISTDYGVTGTDRVIATGQGTGANGVATSETCKYILVTFNERAFVSNDFGSTWTEVLASEGESLEVNTGSAVSSSGKHMVVGTYSSLGMFYLSDDFGVTWQTITISGSVTNQRGLAVDD